MEYKVEDFVSLKEYLQEKFLEIREHIIAQDQKIKEIEKMLINTTDMLSIKLENLEKRLEDKIQCQAKKWIEYETEKKIKSKFITILITILGAISGFLGGMLAKGG